jgi:ferrous iron transport protein A
MSQPTPRRFPLFLAQEGERVKIINAQGKLRERLASMSLGIGDEVEVLANQGHGPLLIRKRENRFALGGGMAHKIEVEIVEKTVMREPSRREPAVIQ